MTKQHIQDYLKARGLRKTAFRIELLKLFLESKHSLSHQDIRRKITSTQDKVTIYRGLTTFLEKGLIHKVLDANQVFRYALTIEENPEDAPKHNHAHFLCKECHNTFCLYEVKLPEYKDVDGFQVINSKLTLEGYCPDCI
ncbi:hypothetical protein BKI52_39865 [marine bacterium AO1-C]|nr:hypothetical protein BKI52_39865 [marine bacterium AO1-C]